jgi:hypothetical protein
MREAIIRHQRQSEAISGHHLSRRGLDRQHGLHELHLLGRKKRCEVLLHVVAPEHAHLMKEAIERSSEAIKRSSVIALEHAHLMKEAIERSSESSLEHAHLMKEAISDPQ